jgi:hypothetical protein
MNTAEKFALDEHLSDYPEDATYDEVCDLILDEDESVIVWAPLEHTPPSQIVETIDCTRLHFKAVVDKLLNAQGEDE